MNKLLLNNETLENQIIVDSDLDIEIDTCDTSKELTIEVMPNVCLKIFDKSNNTSNKITFNIGENCNVYVNKLSKDCNDTVTVNINDERTTVKYNSSIINYKDNEYRQIINHNNKNSESKIVNHCINTNDSNFKFIVDGVIKKESTNTTFKQDNKIINLKDGNSAILPNLIVDNNDIDASHSAYVGSFEDETMFYLMTRGISEDECNKLLMKAFLINTMDLTEEEKDYCIGVIDNI